MTSDYTRLIALVDSVQRDIRELQPIVAELETRSALLDTVCEAFGKAASDPDDDAAQDEWWATAATVYDKWEAMR